MNEAQVVSLTAELRTSNTPSSQRLFGPGSWLVDAQAASPVTGATVLDIAQRHGVTGYTTRAKFTGTSAQTLAVIQALTAQKMSVVVDYLGNGTTDVWAVTAASGIRHPIVDVIALANTNGVTVTTARAEFI